MTSWVYFARSYFRTVEKTKLKKSVVNSKSTSNHFYPECSFVGLLKLQWNIIEGGVHEPIQTEHERFPMEFSEGKPKRQKPHLKTNSQATIH